MKPYVRELRHDMFERRKRYNLRMGLKRQITIPINLSKYVLSKKLAINIWINKKGKLEIAASPVDLKKTNGIVLLRRLLTNGHSFSFVIPPSAYEVLSNTYDTHPIKKMNIVKNSRNNLELAPTDELSRQKDKKSNPQLMSTSNYTRG